MRPTSSSRVAGPTGRNDQAFVEQKNGAVVRRMVGYHPFEGLEAAKLLAELYRSARLFVNFFQPSFKFLAKQRDGACVRKTYSAPATPHQRLVADARTPDAVRHHLQDIYAALDPVALLRDIRGAQERLAALAETQPVADAATASQSIDLFLASLRTAWKDGAMDDPLRARRAPSRVDLRRARSTRPQLARGGWKVCIELTCPSKRACAFRQMLSGPHGCLPTQALFGSAASAARKPLHNACLPSGR